MKTFNFRIIVDTDLRTDEIWPEDNCPPNPSAEEVHAALIGWCLKKHKGDFSRTLVEWGLDPTPDCLTVTDVTERREVDSKRMQELQQRLRTEIEAGEAIRSRDVDAKIARRKELGLSTVCTLDELDSTPMSEGYSALLTEPMITGHWKFED